MKKSIYFDQNGFLETMNKYEPYMLRSSNKRKEKLTVKLKRQKVIIDYNANVLSIDNGCFKFDNITFDYSNYNLFQIVELWLKGEIITTLFFDEKDTFKVIYKDEFAFCNCNRTLEYLIARYRKLKGGE